MTQRFRAKTKYETDNGLVGRIYLGSELSAATYNPEPAGAISIPRVSANLSSRRAGLKPRHIVCTRQLRPATADAGEQRATQRFIIKTLDSLSAISPGTDIELDGKTWSVVKRVNEAE